MTRLARRIGWGLMTFLAISVALGFAAPYLSLNPAVSKIDLNPSVALQFPILVIHATTGGLALMIGPFQFLSRLRTKYPALHRTLGRIYLICIFVGGLAALFSALASTSGLAAQLGFASLALIWLYSAYRAYEAIRRGHIQIHRIWMTRNYSLTLAAVILRIWLVVGTYLLGIPFHEVYVSAAWVSWILPLLVVEWFVNQRLLQALAVKKDRQPVRQKALQPLSVKN